MLSNKFLPSTTNTCYTMHERKLWTNLVYSGHARNGLLWRKGAIGFSFCFTAHQSQLFLQIQYILSLQHFPNRFNLNGGIGNNKYILV